MANREVMIKLRIDVDYPYTSRIKSFLYTVLNCKTGKDYLKNSKIIARMINESSEEVKAYWFFTPKTIPDKELLSMLNADRHEVALHIANSPEEEWKLLEKATGRRINYYTTHGTARLLARIMWKRWKAKTPDVPKNFPLQSFYQFPTLGLDSLCYTNNTAVAVRMAKSAIAKGEVLHIHPEWLFQRGKINFRGPYYETLKRILEVDKELERLALRRKIFFILANDVREYEKDVIPTEKFLEKLRERKVDVFAFIERKWISQPPNAQKDWVGEEDNIGLLRVISYEKWLRDVVKKTRHNMVRKAEKNGVRIEIVALDEEFVEDVWKIYNETPIRQNRAFPHYGISLETVRKMLLTGNCTHLGAYLQDELIGFAQIVHGDNIAILVQLLSLQRHWDKAVNNALIARAVQVCESKNIKWLMYGRMETAHPSLDSFKRHNGFSKFPLTRFYIPLTKKGKIAVKLGLHRDLKDTLPKSIKYPLIPIYNWISRTKIRIRLMLKKG
jgi:hypothetical protein